MRGGLRAKLKRSRRHSRERSVLGRALCRRAGVRTTRACGVGARLCCPPHARCPRGGCHSRVPPSPISRRWLSERRRGCRPRSEEHTSELQSRGHLVCRLLLEKKKTKPNKYTLNRKKTHRTTKT